MTKYFVKLKYWTVSEMFSAYEDLEQGSDSKKEALEEFFLDNGEYPEDEIDILKVSLLENWTETNEDKH